MKIGRIHVLGDEGGDRVLCGIRFPLPDGHWWAYLGVLRELGSLHRVSCPGCRRAIEARAC